MMAMGGQRRSVNRRLEIERTRSERKKKKWSEKEKEEKVRKPSYIFSLHFRGQQKH